MSKVIDSFILSQSTIAITATRTTIIYIYISYIIIMFNLTRRSLLSVSNASPAKMMRSNINAITRTILNDSTRTNTLTNTTARRNKSSSAGSNHGHSSHHHDGMLLLFLLLLFIIYQSSSFQNYHCQQH